MLSSDEYDYKKPWLVIAENKPSDHQKTLLLKLDSSQVNKTQTVKNNQAFTLIFCKNQSHMSHLDLILGSTVC